ncbi:MAG: hypothetical protein IKX92_02615 [Clostridia bacterium]|nr:hypothetical protein [Clostridia bacterium]
MSNNPAITETIRAEESRFDSALASAAKHICSSAEKRFLLLGGGSCSGKTTCAAKLKAMTGAFGRECHVLSLDDYYRSLDESVYLPDGTRDVESIRSLRLDILCEDLKKIAAGETVRVPFFDFTVRRRLDLHRELRAGQNDVVIIEGLHALNPQITGGIVGSEELLSVYLYADPGDGSDRRLIRRLVRDSRHRDSGAVRTFGMWNTVRGSERFTIEPFSADADISLNTFLPYERGLLDPLAVPVLAAVPKHSRWHRRAQGMIKELSCPAPVPPELVPQHSLLREFI